jgi:hypothetical protein
VTLLGSPGARRCRGRWSHRSLEPAFGAGPARRGGQQVRWRRTTRRRRGEVTTSARVSLWCQPTPRWPSRGSEKTPLEPGRSVHPSPSHQQRRDGRWLNEARTGRPRRDGPARETPSRQLHGEAAGSGRATRRAAARAGTGAAGAAAREGPSGPVFSSRRRRVGLASCASQRGRRPGRPTAAGSTCSHSQWVASRCHLHRRCLHQLHRPRLQQRRQKFHQRHLHRQCLRQPLCTLLRYTHRDRRW